MVQTDIRYEQDMRIIHLDRLDKAALWPQISGAFSLPGWMESLCDEFLFLPRWEK
jgi:hypothetical protein